MSTAEPGDADTLAERIAGLPRPLLVALDVDGTLAPIVDDPGAARVPDATRRLIGELSKREGVRVALVTGRDAGSLARVAGELPVWRAVSHGRTVLAPGDDASAARPSAEEQARLDAFEQWARREVVPRGARLERKDGAVAVHVRELARRDGAAAETLLERARARAEQEGLSPRLGRAVCEAEVESGDKGAALRKLVEATGAQGIVYAGDDLTDLPALDFATQQGGVGLFVRSSERQPPPTVTTTVEGPEAVAQLLRALLERLPATLP